MSKQSNFRSKNSSFENVFSNKTVRQTSSNSFSGQSFKKGEVYQPHRSTQANSQYEYSSPLHYASADSGQEIIRQKEEALHFLRQDKIGPCLEKMQNVIEAGSEYFNKDSMEFRTLFNEAMQVLCDYSIKLLGQNEFEKSIDILMACHRLSDASLYYEQIPEKRIQVLNNLGCVFRKMGRLGKARIFLEEAYSLVQKFPHVKYSGVTYMNICAVVSQAGMHDRALQYARFGLQECQRQLLEFLNDPYQKGNIANLTEKVKFNAISFHNVGVEEEYFKNFDKAKDYFRQSYSQFEDHGLSLSDPLYLKFKQSYQRCVQVIQRKFI